MGDERRRKRKYNSSSSGPQQQQQKQGEQGLVFRRGEAGVLLTCEHGREIKCEREGLEMLQFYMDQRYPQHHHHQSSSGEERKPVEKRQSSNSNEKASLEQELVQLRQNNQQLLVALKQQPTTTPSRTTKKNKQTLLLRQHSDFVVYDTGCRGTILAICIRPNFRLIPISKKQQDNDNPCDKPETRPEKRSSIGNNEEESEQAVTRESDNHAPTTEDKTSDSALSTTVREAKTHSVSAITNHPAPNANEPWDPVTMVHSIFKQLQPIHDDKGDKTNQSAVAPPSSRFVTRMIPLQAICFASLDDIQATATALLVRFLRKEPQRETKLDSLQDDDDDTKQSPVPTTTTTAFAISVKRRNCSHLTSSEIIERLASQVIASLVPTWKVNLKNPDVRIWIEICRTTVGLSVFGCQEQPQENFNIAIVQTSQCN